MPEAHKRVKDPQAIRRRLMDEAKKLARDHGAQIATSITKKVTHVIAGEKAGSKLRKAQELEKVILSETEFLSLIKMESNR